MEDALNAPQQLLVPRCNAVKGFVVVFQGSAALSAERKGGAPRHPHTNTTSHTGLRGWLGVLLPLPTLGTSMGTMGLR